MPSGVVFFKHFLFWPRKEITFTGTQKQKKNKAIKHTFPHTFPKVLLTLTSWGTSIFLFWSISFTFMYWWTIISEKISLWKLIINFGILPRRVQVSLIYGNIWLNVYITQFLIKNHCFINMKYELILYNIPKIKEETHEACENEILDKICSPLPMYHEKSKLNNCKFLGHFNIQHSFFCANPIHV